MPENSKVSTLVDKHLAQANQHAQGQDNDDNNNETDADALFAQLEAEDDSAFRSQRAQQLSDELSKLKPAQVVVAQNAASLYLTLHSDDEVLRFTTEHDKVVVHFFHPDFGRCAVMHEHLTKLAELHGRFGGGAADGDGVVRFGKVDVKDAAFVVEKLGVRVLPCVVGFLDGVAKGRLVGFERVCWNSKESHVDVTRNIEAALIDWKLCERRLMPRADEVDRGESDEEEEERRKKASGRHGIQGRKQKVDDEDDDWD